MLAFKPANQNLLPGTDMVEGESLVLQVLRKYSVT